MDLFPGFTWPVPRAFSSAVAACRFEQGDVLYDHPIVYSGAEGSSAAPAAASPGASPQPANPRASEGALQWGSVASVLGHHVQVLEPPRSARLSPADSVGRRFLANWEAPICFEKCDYRSGRTETVKSTQGRLFTCLWRGDSGLLGPDEAGRESPPPPALARELHRELEQTLAALRRAAAERYQLEGALIFAFVVDESSEASLAKERAIVSALRSRHATHSIDLMPSDVELPEVRDFHPALRVRGCLIEAASEQAVQSLLKSCLYGPTREPAVGSGSAGRSREPAAVSNRFRLERHGLLVEARTPQDPIA